MSSLINQHWLGVKDGDNRALALIKRHYTWREYKDRRPHHLFVGPGEKMVLITQNADALFVWRKYVEIGQSTSKGISCAVFRNEGQELSSNLIREAEQLACERWPNERLYTYVNPLKIKSHNPGACFIYAGWQRCGKTKGGLLILEKYCQDVRH
jgi:hypothetical protein